MPHGASSTRSTSANASSACFDAAYGPRNGSALRPPTEPMSTRARVLPERGQHRLEHGDLADDVHLELTAELVERDELERRRDRDARVVDEPVELRPDLLQQTQSALASVTSSRRARSRAPELPRRRPSTRRDAPTGAGQAVRRRDARSRTTRPATTSTTPITARSRARPRAAPRRRPRPRRRPGSRRPRRTDPRGRRSAPCSR